jgi:hypothetical protein
MGVVLVKHRVTDGKLCRTIPPAEEYDVRIRFISEETHSAIIAIFRADGTPLNGDEKTIYSLTDQEGKIYKWRWSGRKVGMYYLGEVVG